MSEKQKQELSEDELKGVSAGMSYDDGCSDLSEEECFPFCDWDATQKLCKPFSGPSTRG